MKEKILKLIKDNKLNITFLGERFGNNVTVCYFLQEENGIYIYSESERGSEKIMWQIDDENKALTIFLVNQEMHLLLRSEIYEDFFRGNYNKTYEEIITRINKAAPIFGIKVDFTKKSRFSIVEKDNRYYIIYTDNITKKEVLIVDHNNIKSAGFVLYNMQIKEQVIYNIEEELLKEGILKEKIPEEYYYYILEMYRKDKEFNPNKVI